MTKQEIYDRFSFLEGLVSEDTYRRIVETAVQIQSTAVMPAAPSDAVTRGLIDALDRYMRQDETAADTDNGVYRRRCQHCGHAWQTNEKEHHALNCAYVIATSVPHTPPTSRDEAPTTPSADVSLIGAHDAHPALLRMPAAFAWPEDVAALTQLTTVQQADS